MENSTIDFQLKNSSNTKLGELLASAGDDGNVLLWTPSENPAFQSNFGDDGQQDLEHWRVKTMCRSSTGSEIYDLAWSPDGMFFVTGSMDNVARIYNATNGTSLNKHGRGIFRLTGDRPHCSTNSRAQSLCARCCLGSVKRIHCYSVVGSISAYIHTQDQGRTILVEQQDHEDGSTRQTHLIE